ncbi:prepilin-type N-terminal cleavage/methylation domain-containing protein [Lysobacter pythonis]|uniref:Prepilin-type N-terminal cleavage/methylation domain-containing protein n=1 Tax=Solilutibacter pythonis TaxID=2483112 RepID=A0A3M2I5J6_9GAMM|nr:prepilin-type N-terminal cleavage/methylation domain-containing protein [Lysobacter pythonis]RMH93534.1 prepilin-type N-terminal cleavage/methylation domain-containing protein [Lysobacter pythonis]
MKRLRVSAGQRGFTLIELMIALVLGLVVVAAAGGIFISNRRVYGTTESINRIQENQRAAFELLVRDIREAGGNPCLRFTASNTPVVQLTRPDALFWQRYPAGIFGVDASSPTGSDSISIYHAGDSLYSVAEHKSPTDAITVDTTGGLSNGQVLMVCNADHAIVFSASGVTSGGKTIGHDGALNCGRGLTPTPDYSQCKAASSGPGYCFKVPGVPPGKPTPSDTAKCPRGIGRSPAFVVVPSGAQWTVESNGRGGTSLYRTVLGVRNEIAEGVSSMRLAYKVGATPNYSSAATVTAANAWMQVTAVHVQLKFEAAQGAMTRGDVRGTDNATLSRTMNDYVVLRNHVDIQ